MPNPSRVNGTEDSEDVTGQPDAQPVEPLLTTDPMANPVAVPVRPRYHIVRAILLWLVLAAIVSGGVVLWLQRDAALDWLHGRNYEAPKEISDLADATTMTAYGKRLFYVNYPAIEDKNAFNRDCPDASHEVAVLGCYTGNRNGIYLYHVTDSRLAGITEVTAAHEMLHQAFDRLSPSDRKNVTDMLNDYYKNKLTDKNVIDKMASYKKLEPDDMVNEMHSVFGTEIANLPPGLETYYKRYFTDRIKVVALRDHYVSAFSQRQQQIDAYDARRDTLKTQIDQAQTDLDNWEKSLRSQRDQMATYMDANKIEQYNALVPGFNTQVAAYKKKVADTNDLINEYNRITDERNALTAQEQELIKAQDSHASSANAE